MPCVGTALRDELYRDILAELQALISDHSDSHCFIGGYFNVDLNSNVSTSQVVNEFILFTII